MYCNNHLNNAWQLLLFFVYTTVHSSFIHRMFALVSQLRFVEHIIDHLLSSFRHIFRIIIFICFIILFSQTSILLFCFACVYCFYFIPHFADVVDYSDLILPTESSGATLYPPVFRPKGIQKKKKNCLIIISHLALSYRYIVVHYQYR